ncbi:MAG: DMT family transporter [Bacteroidales bacterium]|nr:DMT family transporter [Bacteroidales bacterium]MDD3664609.1 DMT family transporter [Bacteroidales bacterium]
MQPPVPYAGELAALATAFFWTTTALSFEMAAKRVGSLAVNILRLLIAFFFLSAFTWIYRGMALPFDATPHNWMWLTLSGLVGFVFGDYCLFRSYTLVSARVAMLIMTLVPPITALIGWIMLNETMSLQHLGGMTLTLSGIALTILARSTENGKVGLNYPLKGLLFALGGAVGQAVGLVISKYGMGDYDPFAASHIRIMAGAIGFGLIVVMFKKTSLVKSAVSDQKAMKGVAIGSFFGPFLGVSFSLLSVRYTSTGIASTLMAIVPVLIIAPAVLLFHQRVTLREIAGAAISVIGVVLFFV